MSVEVGGDVMLWALAPPARVHPSTSAAANNLLVDAVVFDC